MNYALVRDVTGSWGRPGRHYIHLQQHTLPNLDHLKMVHCIAFGCNNNDRNTKGKSVSFHRLPVTKPDLLKVWLQRLKLKDPTVTPNVRVCSEHFKHECYERDLSAELLNRKPKIKLKTDAFPTEFCFTKASAPRESSMRRQTLRERQQVSNSMTNRHHILSQTQWFAGG